MRRSSPNSRGLIGSNAFFEILEDRLALSGNPTLVKDITPSTLGSATDELASDGGVAIYGFNDGVHGYELWRTDGTAEGTFLLKDIFPGDRQGGGKNSGLFGNLTVGDGAFYFTANDGIHGTELWKTDGSVAGTVLVEDILTGPGSSEPDSLAWFNGQLYFEANNELTGSELWATDGTSLGTRVVVDFTAQIAPLQTGSRQLETRLFFNAGVNFRQSLWKTDGTPNGALFVSNSSFDTASAFKPPVFEFGTQLLFRGTDGELWKSDGTPTGTIRITNVRPGFEQFMDYVPQFTEVNGVVYFFANDGNTGRELWKTDGTTVGTVLVMDIFPGQAGQSERSQLESMADINGTLMFRANDGVHGDELWKSDGTAIGTRMVHDIRPGPESSFSGNNGFGPAPIIELNGSAVFWVNNGVTGLELWTSNGTTQGTLLVKDIYPGMNDSGAGRAAAHLGNSVLFFADDAIHGSEIWKTNGTPLGTLMIKDANTLGQGSVPAEFVSLNGDVFFAAFDWDHGRELWKSGGTAATTTLVKDIGTGVYSLYVSGDPSFLTVSGDYLFFAAFDADHGYELWRSDGTDEGTALVSDIRPGPESSLTSNSTHVPLFDVNGTLYFVADDGVNGPSLWKTTGLVETTKRIKSFSFIQTNESQKMTVVNGILFFVAADASDLELWKSDGTEAGTVRVKEIMPGVSGSSPLFLTNVGGTLYFQARDEISGYELWKSDGTEDGTFMVKDIFQGQIGSSPRFLTNVEGTLYFSASNGFPSGNGNELWRSDGTEAGTVMVKDILPGSGSASPASLINVGGTVYFTANDGTTGLELWKSDGTSAGTMLVKDIYAGPNGIREFVDTELVNVNGTLYFRANDGITGTELWKSDGTAAGTVQVKDFLTGVRGSFPENLTSIDGRLYFSVADEMYGREPWIVESTLTGDFSSDGKIDNSDYALWKSAFASTTDLRADGNGNNVVDAADYVVWRKALGQSAVSTSIGRDEGIASAQHENNQFWPGEFSDLHSPGSVNVSLFATTDGSTQSPAEPTVSSSGHVAGRTAFELTIVDWSTRVSEFTIAGVETTSLSQECANQSPELDQLLLAKNAQPSILSGRKPFLSKQSDDNFLSDHPWSRAEVFDHFFTQLDEGQVEVLLDTYLSHLAQPRRFSSFIQVDADLGVSVS